MWVCVGKTMINHPWNHHVYHVFLGGSCTYLYHTLQEPSYLYEWMAPLGLISAELQSSVTKLKFCWRGVSHAPTQPDCKPTKMKAPQNRMLWSGFVPTSWSPAKWHTENPPFGDDFLENTRGVSGDSIAFSICILVGGLNPSEKY